MGHRGIVGKASCLTVALVLASLLGGCGQAGERTQKAMRLIGERDYQGALELLAGAAEGGEDARLIDRARGIAYMGLADYGEAAAFFEASLAGSRGLVQDVDFDLNLYLAAAYTEDGRYGEAEAVYDAVLALRPGEAETYFLRGNVRLAQGAYEEARADFDRVIAMEPRNYDRLIEIHRALDYSGYGEAGREYLRAALASGDKEMDRYASGRIYYYLGEYQSACLALEEARDKGGAKSYLYLGKSYEAMGDYNYAANVYTSYLDKKEGDAEIYNQLGLCEMARKEYRKALESFQAGLKLEDGGMAQSLSFNEIVAYEYLGEYRQACLLMESYLKRYPEDGRAEREYEFLSTR